MNNQMKSCIATLDDTHELARLNAVFNGVQVEPEQLSSRLQIHIAWKRRLLQRWTIALPAYQNFNPILKQQQKLFTK